MPVKLGNTLTRSVLVSALIYVGLRAPGVYYVLFFLALFFVSSRLSLSSKSCRLEVAYLGGYCILIFLQAITDSLGGGLSQIVAARSELLLPINLFLLFVCGGIICLERRIAVLCLASLGGSAAISASILAYISRFSPASNLRPLENLFTIGILILSYLFAFDKSKRFIPPWVVIFFCLTSLPPLLFFRGVLSMSSVVVILFAGMVNLGANWLNRIRENRGGMGAKSVGPLTVSFSITSLVAVCIAAGKGNVFRYTWYQFIGSNPLNGRWDLLIQSADIIVSGPFVALGRYPSIPEGLWSHSYIVDTILFHGWLPCVFLLAFLFQLLFKFMRYSLMAKLILIILAIGASLQPVEFSDGIAYQLSFFLLGIIAREGSGGGSRFSS